MQKGKHIAYMLKVCNWPELSTYILLPSQVSYQVPNNSIQAAWISSEQAWFRDTGLRRDTCPSATAPPGIMGTTNSFTSQQNFTRKVVKSTYGSNGLFKKLRGENSNPENVYFQNKKLYTDIVNLSKSRYSSLCDMTQGFAFSTVLSHSSNQKASPAMAGGGERMRNALIYQNMYF